jgi:uncharacterized protein YggE
MKAIFLVPVVVLSLTAMEINFKKKFDLEIKPNTLQADVNIVVKKQSEKDVIEKLSHYSSYFEASKEVEKSGGNYNVRAEYRYENNHRYKSGYLGNMYYQVKAKESDKLSQFITSLYSQKSDEDVDISTSSVSWIMSKEQKEGKIDQLRLDAIVWAGTYAKKLSSKLSKSCDVSNISFDNIQHSYPKPMMRNYEERVMMDKAMTAPIPTQDIQKISINPTFKYECK